MKPPMIPVAQRAGDETWVEPLFEQEASHETHLVIATGIDDGLLVEAHLGELLAWRSTDDDMTDMLHLCDPDTVAALPPHLRHALGRHVAEVAVRLGLPAHKALTYHARLACP